MSQMCNEFVYLVTLSHWRHTYSKEFRNASRIRT